MMLLLLQTTTDFRLTFGRNYRAIPLPQKKCKIWSEKPREAPHSQNRNRLPVLTLQAVRVIMTGVYHPQPDPNAICDVDDILL